MHSKGQCTAATVNLCSQAQTLEQDQELAGIFPVCRDFAPASCTAKVRVSELVSAPAPMSAFLAVPLQTFGVLREAILKNNPTVNWLQIAMQEAELPWGNRDFSNL